MIIKTGSGIKRDVRIINITGDQYRNLKREIDRPFLKKHRYEIAFENQFGKLDIYKGRYEGLVTLEFEYNSKDHNPNDIVDRVLIEVTTNEKFKNKNLFFNSKGELLEGQFHATG